MDTYDSTICFTYALQYRYSLYLFNPGTPSQQNQPCSFYTAVPLRQFVS